MRVQILLDGTALFDSGDADPPDTLYKTLAALWAGMTDDDQARFFEEVGRIVSGWGGLGWDGQACYIGKHMATCDCITDVGRGVLRTIVAHMDYRDPTPASRASGAEGGE